MKIILLLLTVTLNAFCMGQKVDSIYVNKDESFEEAVRSGTIKLNANGSIIKEYNIDSITVDSDTTHLFIYHKSGKIDTVELEIIPKTTFGEGVKGKYINESIIEIQMDSGSGSSSDYFDSSLLLKDTIDNDDWNFVIHHNTIYDIPDTMPKLDTTWVHTGTNDSIIWRVLSEKAEIMEPSMKGVLPKEDFYIFDNGKNTDTIPKVYGHISDGVTLSSFPPCYQCKICGKIYSTIDGVGCIPNEYKDTVWLRIDSLNYVNYKSNISPIALAGVDRHINKKTKTLTLNGTGIDEDGTIVQYNWKQIYGIPVPIKNPRIGETTISGLKGAGIYIFELEVIDNMGAKDKDNVMIIVNTF